MTIVRTCRAVRATADEGVAMVTALIAIMLTAMFSILLLGLLLSQATPTQFERTSSQTIFAAEAGVNAVVGQIRNAAAAPDVTGTIYGDNAQLPCTTQGPVDGATDEVEYDVTIRYYVQDPTNQSEAWRVSHALGCVPGTGPSADPGYALITATGTGSPVTGMDADAGSRTVSVVYEFQVTNNNIPGGLIYSFDIGQPSDRFCLEAESAAAGSFVKYIPAIDCGTDDLLQLWIYDKDYRIKLASTTVDPTASPLCVTATPNGSTPVKATLEVCKPATDAGRWNQLFSWEGGAKWRGQQNPISAGYSSYYLSSGVSSGAPTGRYLSIWNQSANNNEWGSFNPNPRVGAGAAGASTHQIVNYLEFGRCFDVTHGTVTEPQMIIYPCKQDPNPAQTQLNWNHKWYYTDTTVGAVGPQLISILKDNTTKYCLVSPGTEGGFVTLTSSCNLANKNQQWTRYGNTGSYSTSYTLVDGYGRCAGVGPSYHVGATVEPWSTIVTQTCNTGLGQKWNAPPNTISASLDGYWELP